jgi:hypothetical protein
MPLRAMRMSHEWIGPEVVGTESSGPPEAQEENKVVRVGLMVS